jgi:hypothetical protein
MIFPGVISSAWDVRPNPFLMGGISCGRPVLRLLCGGSSLVLYEEVEDELLAVEVGSEDGLAE